MATNPGIMVIGQGVTNIPAVVRSPLAWSARGRTAAMLPTAAVINNFDIGLLLSQPMAGSLLMTDFNTPSQFPHQTFKDTSSTILQGTSQVTSYNGLGELAFLTAADNEAAEAQWMCPIIVTGSTPWAFGVRMKVSSVTTEKGSFEIGLSNAQTLVGNLQADGGAVPTTSTDYLIFNTDAAATTALDIDYLLSGATHTEHKAAFHTMVADTYLTAELYYNGTTIATYLNGVATADTIAATDIVDGNFPAAQVCVPTIGVKGAHTDAYTVTLDWLYAVQHGV